MREEQLADIWLLFKDYLDKKQIDIVAEKYVDLLADYGINDEILKELIGTDRYLDNAINYYLELDNNGLDEDDWDN